MVKDRGKAIVIKTEDVAYFSAEGDYVMIHARGKTYLHREPLSTLEKRLDPTQFCRIHRSTIIRINLIKELEPLSKGDYLIKLTDGAQFTLSRTHRNRLFDVLNQQRCQKHTWVKNLI